MRVNEVKETREVVVKTEYVATDGKIFDSREECQKYEKTCKCVIMSAYKPLVKRTISEYGLYEECGCEEFYYDLVEIKNENDREIVNKALKFAYAIFEIVSTLYLLPIKFVVDLPLAVVLMWAGETPRYLLASTAVTNLFSSPVSVSVTR